MPMSCADEVVSEEALVRGFDEGQQVLDGLDIKAFCKSLQRSADLAEMKARVAALDAETDHARWNLLLKKFATLGLQLKNSSSMSVFKTASPVEPFQHFCGLAQGRSPVSIATLPQKAPPVSHWNRLLPSLFIIGSVKAGTTSLWSHLVDATGGAILPRASSRTRATSLARRRISSVTPTCGVEVSTFMIGSGQGALSGLYRHRSRSMPHLHIMCGTTRRRTW
jgi:hypothetical protein